MSRTQPGREDQPRGQKGDLRSFIAEIVARLDIPLGFTLTIWSAGHICLARYGLPSYLAVFLFVVGALAAYLLVAYTIAPRRPGTGQRTRTARLAIVDPPAVLLAVGSATVVFVLPSPLVGYFVVAFVTAGIYILSIGLFEYLAKRLALDHSDYEGYRRSSRAGPCAPQPGPPRAPGGGG
jgi:hypothetical protein